MQPKFTLKRVKALSWLTPVFFVLFFLFAGKINAQTYINGNLSTGTIAGGVTAPAGTTWSELQPGNNNFGNSASIAAGFGVADDFIVPAGPSWALTKFTGFVYSTGAPGGTSPFNDIRVRIFNTDPSVGNPAPIFGDLTTNRFLASSDALMFRCVSPGPLTNRIIWKVEANVNITLAPGTYWVEWQFGTALASNFSPPSTVAGTVTQPGNNAYQHTVGANTWAALTDLGGPQDMPFIINYATAPCSGTPAPGATLPATSAVCPGAAFNLSLQNITPGSGVTYQWQSGPSATGPWTNITGAINSTYSSTIVATTYYQCIVTCSGNSQASSPAVVNLNPPSACYCANTATDPADEDIFNVTVGTLNNSSTCASTGPGFGSVNSLYANYTSGTGAPAAPNVLQGANNPFSVQVGTCGGNYGNAVAIWIDLNQDGTFQHPAERVYVSAASTTGPHVEAGNLLIPASALLGTTRMRVQVREFGTAANMLPCGTFTWGEVEDYNVNIVPCIPALISSSPSSVSVTCGQSTSFTAAATGSLPAFSWEWRPNSSSAWFNVTNGGIYSGANTATLTLTNVSAAFSGYEYRAVVVGACSATDVSQTATLSVNPIVPVVNPASATICLGAIQQLSLTNTVAEPATTTFTATTGLPLSIPDDGTGVGILTSPLAISGIPAGSVIKNVAVKFTMTHTWAGDIVLNLKAPNNQVLNLIAALDGGAGSNSTANFTNTTVDSLSTTPMSGAPAPRTGTFRADRFNVTAGAMGVAPTTTNFWAPLLATINGNWTLAFSDLGPGDVGNLLSWSVAITYVAPNFAQGVWTGPAGTMFTDAGAITPYTGTPATTIYVKPTVTSNYNVSFTTTTPCTSSTTTVPVTVNNPITGLTVAPATRAVCIGGSTTFTSSITTGSPVTYQWQQSIDGGLVYTNINGATSSTLTLSSVTASMTGYKYRVVATVGVCGVVTSTAIGTLTVNALPVVNLSSPDLMLIPGQFTTISATSSPAAQATNSWIWRYNGSVVPNKFTSVLDSITVDKLGSYTASVTDVNGCVNSSSAIVVGAEATDKLWIYPNPTTGNFYIRLYFGGELTETRKVSIYNPTGQLLEIRELTLLNTANPYQRMDFNLGGVIAKGSYVVKVVQKNSGKIISGIILVQ